MSKAKYIITFFIFLAVLLFIGESYTFYLENFQDTYTQVGYFLPAGDSEQLMNKTILEKADEYEAPVFALEKNQNGIFSRKITIYGNDEIREKLKSDWNIDDEPKKSFFSGTTVFEFQPFEKASEKIMQNCWYPYSSQDEIYEMVYQGMEKYSGAFRNDPISSTSKIVVAGVWGLALLVVILLTLYDISYGKKEQGIRVILGEDNTKMKWRKVLSDFWGILISFGLALLLLIPFTTPEFEIELTLCSFFVIIIINSAIVLWKMSINRISIIRESLSHRVLDMSMLMKGIIATLSIIILSITIGLCVEGVKLYIQRDYYITQNDYVHVEIDYPFVDEKIEYSENAIDGVDTLDTTDQISDDFLRYSYQKLDCRLLYNYSYKDVAPKYGVRYIYANLRGLEQYKNQIEDWDRLISNEGNYILISDQMNKDEVVNELLSIGNVLNISNDNLAGVYTYKHGLSVIAEGKQADEYNYTYCIKNPVIILDTYNYGSLPTYEITYSLHKREAVDGVIFRNAPYLMQFTSVKDDIEDIYNFANICGGDAIIPSFMEFSIENVGDWYQGLWELQNRSLLIAIILTILLLVLEIQITTLVLRILYEVKAKELTIKKILGYSIFERYKGFFVLSGVICGIALMVSVCIYIITNIGIIKYLCVSSLSVWLIDWIILLIITNHSDRLEIQKVLKGGI